MRTIDRKDRIKENLRGLVSYMERISKKRGNSLRGIDDIRKKLERKNFNPNEDLYKKSKNLKHFLNHRQKLNTFNRNGWKNFVYLPYVMRFHKTDLSPEIENEIKDFLSTYPFLTLGCHNVADRISIKFPDKISSVRTRLSFPHYGYDELFRSSMGSKVHPFTEKTTQITRRILDNGKMWLNHSINLVKDENEYSRFFKDKKTSKSVDEINPLKETNPKLYDFIGNGVLVDYDVMHFGNLGVYDSFQYRGLEVFSFENFSQEELEWVEDWLDYEFFQLYFVDKSVPFHYLINTYDNYMDDFFIAVLELSKEIGNKYLKYLVIHDLDEWFISRCKLIEEKYGRFSTEMETWMAYFEGDLRDDDWEIIMKNEMLNAINVWEKQLEDKVKYMNQKFQITDENQSPTKDLEGDELLNKKKAFVISMLEDGMDLQTLKPKK